MSVTIEDKHADHEGRPRRWTFGSQDKDKAGLFGGAYPDGRARLHYWIDKGEGGQVLVYKVVKCRSYRRAVRVLRWHLMGYKV